MQAVGETWRLLNQPKFVSTPIDTFFVAGGVFSVSACVANDITKSHRPVTLLNANSRSSDLIDWLFPLVKGEYALFSSMSRPAQMVPSFLVLRRKVEHFKVPCSIVKNTQYRATKTTYRLYYLDHSRTPICISTFFVWGRMAHEFPNSAIYLFLDLSAKIYH